MGVCSSGVDCEDMFMDGHSDVDCEDMFVDGHAVVDCEDIHVHGWAFSTWVPNQRQ